MSFIIFFLAFIFLYVFAIAPRFFFATKKKFFKAENLFAHRGLYDNETSAPENSMAAFKNAIEHGFGIETDLRLTRDGVVVLHHDETLERSCGVQKKVSDCSFSELQNYSLFKSTEKIPRLSDLLSLAQNKVPLIIEYKVEASESCAPLCEIASRILSESKKNFDTRYCIESFNSHVLRWYKKNFPIVIRGQLSERFSKTGVRLNPLIRFLLENLLVNFLTRPDFVAWNFSFRNYIPFRVACFLGATPVAWTIQNADELSRAKKMYKVFIFEKFIPAR